MGNRVGRRLLALAALSAVSLVAACGGGGGGESSKSAGQILSEAKSAAAAASSVHVTGTVSTQGQQVPVDLRLDNSGRATGTSAFSGTKVSLIRVGQNIYVKGAEQILGSFLGAKVAAAIDGHWVQISTTMPQLAQLVVVTDKTQLLNQALAAGGSVSKSGTRSVGGREAVVLKGLGSDGSATLLVAETGTPYPLQLVTAAGTLTFSDWGAPLSVQAPTDTVSLASLLGG